MAPARLSLVAALGQPLERVLAHRLEHPEAPLGGGDEALVHERGEPVERLAGRTPPRPPRASSRRRRRRAARTAPARRHRAGRSSSRSSARSVCWRSGASRGPALSRSSRRSRRSRIAGRGEQLAARGGELDRERQAVEALADALDPLAVAGPEREPRVQRPRAAHEQLERPAPGASGAIASSCSPRDVQRARGSSRELRPAARRRAAARAPARRRGPARSCRARAAGRGRRAAPRARRTGCCPLGRAERLGERGHDARRARRSPRAATKRAPSSKRGASRCGQLEREPRLADPARAGQR